MLRVAVHGASEALQACRERCPAGVFGRCAGGGDGRRTSVLKVRRRATVGDGWNGPGPSEAGREGGAWLAPPRRANLRDALERFLSPRLSRIRWLGIRGRSPSCLLPWA